MLSRRLLVPTALKACALALAVCAAAASFAVLLATLALVGCATVSGQILAPLAGDLGEECDPRPCRRDWRFRQPYWLLVSRTVSGLVAGLLGWRAIYIAAAVLSVVLLRRSIPTLPFRVRLGYGQLLGSVFGIIRRESAVRYSLVLGGTSFGLFTTCWTAVTFLLAAPPYSFSVTVIGLIDLAGAATARRAGRLEDRGLGLPTTGIAWTEVLLTLVIAGFGATSIAALIIAIVLLDIAVQAQNITVQTRMFRLDPSRNGSSGQRSQRMTETRHRYDWSIATPTVRFEGMR